MALFCPHALSTTIYFSMKDFHELVDLLRGKFVVDTIVPKTTSNHGTMSFFNRESEILIKITMDNVMDETDDLLCGLLLCCTIDTKEIFNEFFPKKITEFDQIKLVLTFLELYIKNEENE